MIDPRKTQLERLTTKVLADALLQCAARSSEADDIINRVLATPEENTARFKKKMSSFKRRRRFVHYKESFQLAKELEMLLQDLESGVSDPTEGVMLVASFYESDEGIFGHCDDSSGCVGDVFRDTATTLFVKYAKQCQNKEKLADILLSLNQRDNYGVRDTLVDCAKEYLPEDILRSVIVELKQRVSQENDEWARKRYFHLIESLAKQTKDPKLFEESRIASWGSPGPAAIVDIARAYLDCGDTTASQNWIDTFPKGEGFMASERDQLLADLYRHQGDIESLQNILYKQFRSSRSAEGLEKLIEIVGLEKRDEVLAEEVGSIHKNTKLKFGDVEFLISMDLIDDAERYILERAQQLNGHFYGYLIPVVKEMVSNQHYLVASLLLRCLLEDILEKGNTKAYSHGARYLAKISRLAQSITDWKGHESNKAFRTRIGEQHRLKRSFWAKVKD